MYLQRISFQHLGLAKSKSFLYENQTTILFYYNLYAVFSVRLRFSSNVQVGFLQSAGCLFIHSDQSICIVGVKSRYGAVFYNRLRHFQIIVIRTQLQRVVIVNRNLSIANN